MAMATAIKAKESLADYLYDFYSQRRDQIKKQDRRNYSQNEFANDIGIVANTLNRYINGDKGVTLDQAILLLRYFGPEILPHFEYSEAFDETTAEIIARLQKLDHRQQAAAAAIIRQMTDTQEGAGASNGSLVSA